MNKKDIKLITRADDIGSFHSANLAVMEACQKGIVKNISTMVPCPFFEEAAEMFRQLSHICIGLHLTYTAEWDNKKWGPVLSPGKVPSLIDNNGNFLKSPADMFSRGVVFSEMLAEAQAQLDKARILGLNIEYLDEHMVPSWVFEKDDTDRFENHLRSFCKREGLVYWQDVSMKSLPDIESDVVDPVDHFIKQLETANDGTYLVVQHPAYLDEEMNQVMINDSQPGDVARDRDVQRKICCDPRIIDYVQKNGIQLLKYTDVRIG